MTNNAKHISTASMAHPSPGALATPDDRTYGTDDAPLRMTSAQARAVLEMITHGEDVTSVTVHPYSGAATVNDRRECVCMLGRNGETTYRAPDAALRAGCDALGDAIGAALNL